jgi:hypothetical protein
LKLPEFREAARAGFVGVTPADFTAPNPACSIGPTFTIRSGTKTIDSVGIFDAASSGKLFFSSDFSGLTPVSAGEEITFTVKVKFE